MVNLPAVVVNTMIGGAGPVYGFRFGQYLEISGSA